MCIRDRLYAAPETLEGVFNEASDVFSIGLVLFEVFFRFRTVAARVMAIKALVNYSQLPQDYESTSPQVEIIMRCIDPEHTSRPSCQQLLEMLPVLPSEDFEVRRRDSSLTSPISSWTQYKVQRGQVASLKAELEVACNKISEMESQMAALLQQNTQLKQQCTQLPQQNGGDAQPRGHCGSRPLEDGSECCLLYTSDAADEEDSVDLGGRRIL
eukprot:TRINITY_DN10249_c0_g2_i3.p1 TRINITY_DN10249_c0_g2~~TRINITY_DN10249_c0_g2_i3.p1  ORF type:complete len:213 (-),score=40.53 TRINITY_DN10249_c0_g2_i3:66-704(-)